MNVRLYVAAIVLVLLPTFLTPALLGSVFIPIGSGPDELGHLEYSFTKLARPSLSFELDRGIYQPGLGPRIQGHQPPLSYWLGSRVLSIFLAPEEIGAFFDYQAGLVYSSDGLGLGGGSPCLVRADSTREDTNTLRFRKAIIALRICNALLFSLSVILTFLTARLVFPEDRLLVFAATSIHAANPTAIWRSTFVTNDNLVATLGTFVFYLAVRYLSRPGPRYGAVVFAAIFSGLTFLAKYNGVTALGIVGLSVLLKKGQTLLCKLVSLVLLVLTFSLVVVSDLLYNLKVDGDLFSTAYVAHVYPYLYKPSSVLTILKDSYVVRAILSRVWLNFHNVGQLDPTFPLWKIYIWWLLLAATALGVLALCFPNSVPRKTNLRISCLCFGSILGAIAVVIYYCASFPLPGGRYIHMTLPAFSILIVVGIYSLTQLVLRSDLASQTLIAVAALALLLFGHFTTFNYLRSKYHECRNSLLYNVAGGASVATGDLDGDGIDEIGVFRRMSPQIYFAKRNGSSMYRIRADWTRTVGLSGDVFLMGDVTGDGAADALFWRPSAAHWFVVSAAQIIQFDHSLNAFTDYAFSPFAISADASGIPLTADVNLDDIDDLVVYHRARAEWSVFLGSKNSENSRMEMSSKIKFGGAYKQPFVFRRKGEVLFGTYNAKNGVLYLGWLDSKLRRLKLQFEPGLNIQLLDLDRDQVDELLSWHKGEDCIQIHSLREESPNSLTLQDRGDLCLRLNDSPRFGTDYLLLGIRRSLEGPRDLLTFDRRDGQITIFELSDPGDIDQHSSFKINATTELRLGFLSQ